MQSSSFTAKTKPLHLEQTDDRSTPLLTSPPPSQTTLCQRWWKESVWPGLGLFGESYLLFSIGTLRPIWEILFPDCFSGQVCHPRLVHSLTYSVVVGVITGMLSIGYLANSMGRRRGSITTASFMAGGALGLTFVSVFLIQSPVVLYRSMSVLLFVFGVGVGGEYPLSASSASERAMEEMKERMQHESEERIHPRGEDEVESVGEVPPHQFIKRGRKIQLVFTMQGMGIFVNSVVMTVLLVSTGQVDIDDYDADSLLTIWRVSYALGAAVLAFVLVSRIQHLTESEVWAEDKKKREELARDSVPLAYFSKSSPPPILSVTSSVSSLSAPSLIPDMEMVLRQVPSTDPDEDLQSSAASLLLRNYGLRLVGASLSWMLWDVAFYGNKLFQSSFLLALTGDETTLLEFALAATLNSAVALLGYFGAALIVDHPFVGRLRLQQVGFILTGSLFVGCGFLFDKLSSGWLVAMYLGSSFFGQLGPNATTFLIPAEIFPTEMRTMCHGISAASGKMGALLAAVLFNFVGEVDMFLLSGYASFAACLVTFWTIPETTGLDLYEVDRKWRMILDGRKVEYEGDANHPRYLSYYERLKIGLQH